MRDPIIYLPSVIIDSHCHGRDMNQAHKTTVLQTLLEAVKGGISISFFMPNTVPPIIDLDTLVWYIGLTVKAEMGLGLRHRQFVYFGATDYNLEDCRQAMRIPGVVGIKVYPADKKGKTVTTGTIGVADHKTILKLLRLSEETGKPIAFHCDDPEIIAKEGNTIRAETAYVEKILTMAADFLGAKVVICHVSCRQSAELILTAQKSGMQVALELCPHYLWFDANGTHWDHALDPVFYHCFNNLRSKEHRVFLTGLLPTNNPLIIIGSDNAPHTIQEKLSKRYGGLPSNQHMVPVILTLAKQLGLNDGQIANLLCLNTSRFFGVPIAEEGEPLPYRLERRIINAKYNNGKVANPWLGSELYFPVPVEK